MANYVSLLTGPQMDAALMDMALHQSEAFAVGTRDGIDVTSGDVAYHNNAKYYAQQGSIYASQSSSYASSAESSASSASTSANNAEADAERAEDAADRAEQIVGGQFVSYGGDQGLSDAQKSQARKNIGAGATNPNLLDNAWFTNPINQRGASSYEKQSSSSPIYTIDKWALFGLRPNSVTVNSGYIAVNSGVNGFCNFIPDDLAEFLNGKIVTASAMDSAGNIVSVTGTYSNTTQVHLGSGSLGGKTIGFYCGKNSSLGKQMGCSITTGTGVTVNFKAIKLELGTVSTLANDAPPNYAEELAKCQSRFFRLKLEGNKCYGIGFAESATSVRLMIPVPSSMRKSPTITVSGTPRLKGNGQVLVPSAYATNNATNFNASVCVTVTTTGATQYAIYALSTNDSSTYIDFSADL